MTMCFAHYAHKNDKKDRTKVNDMYIRDYFAGFALQGILTKEYIDLPNVKEHIKSAYKIADMMMKERDK